MKQAAPSAWSMPTQPKGQAVSTFIAPKKLPPGTPGAQKLLQRFDEALVCVRHRVTPGGEARCTTVESVLERVHIRSRANQFGGDSAMAKRHFHHKSGRPGVWDPVLCLRRLLRARLDARSCPTV